MTSVHCNIRVDDDITAISVMSLMALLTVTSVMSLTALMTVADVMSIMLMMVLMDVYNVRNINALVNGLWNLSEMV
jgi:hypothetical protein